MDKKKRNLPSNLLADKSLLDGNEKNIIPHHLAKKSLSQLRDEAKKRNRNRVSNLMGLSDATGSMSSLWNETKEIIAELINRMSTFGQLSINWVAYRDYCHGERIIEASGWQSDKKPLLNFLSSIDCIWGDDWPEAVEKGLEYAVNDSRVTRVLLIGDAPPHENRNYIQQAEQLNSKQIPVFSFVVGSAQDTIIAFKKISKITGGKSFILKKVEDLLDVVALNAADDIGGRDSINNYLKNNKNRISENAREYAKFLLTD